RPPPTTRASRFHTNKPPPPNDISNFPKPPPPPPLRLQMFRRRGCETASRFLRGTLPACNTIYVFHPGCKRRRVLVTSSRNCIQKDRANHRGRSRTKALMY